MGTSRLSMNMKKYEKTRKRNKPKTNVAMAIYIQEYFESLWGVIGITEDGEMVEGYKVAPTLSGLANFLGMTRQTLYNYSKLEEYQEVVAEAKSLIEQYNEEMLMTGQGTNAIKFSLINNFGWKEKSEVDNNVNINKKLEDFF